jgi:hypothetical protein
MLSLLLLAPSEQILNSSFELRSTPGWTGLEHLSPNPADVQKVFTSFTKYIRHLYDLSRFGELEPFGDSLLDPVNVYDTLEVDDVHNALFTPSLCLMKDQSICE